MSVYTPPTDPSNETPQERERRLTRARVNAWRDRQRAAGLPIHPERYRESVTPASVTPSVTPPTRARKSSPEKKSRIRNQERLNASFSEKSQERNPFREIVRSPRLCEHCGKAKPQGKLEFAYCRECWENLRAIGSAAAAAFAACHECRATIPGMFVWCEHCRPAALARLRPTAKRRRAPMPDKPTAPRPAPQQRPGPAQAPGPQGKRAPMCVRCDLHPQASNNALGYCADCAEYKNADSVDRKDGPGGFKPLSEIMQELAQKYLDGAASKSEDAS